MVVRKRGTQGGEATVPGFRRLSLKRRLGLLGLVLVVLAAGLACLLPHFIRARASGNMPVCESNLKNIATALEMYATDSGGAFPTTLDSLCTRYLRYVPKCPSAGSVSYAYEVSSTPPAFTLFCRGHHHRDRGLPADYPQYGSRSGFALP